MHITILISHSPTLPIPLISCPYLLTPFIPIFHPRHANITPITPNIHLIHPQLIAIISHVHETSCTRPPPSHFFYLPTCHPHPYTLIIPIKILATCLFFISQAHLHMCPSPSNFCCLWDTALPSCIQSWKRKCVHAHKSDIERIRETGPSRFRRGNCDSFSTRELLENPDSKISCVEGSEGNIEGGKRMGRRLLGL